MKTSDMIGQKFGMLTVTEDSGKRKGHSILWRCWCECGGEILAARHELVSGAVNSCGCVPKPKIKKASDLTGQRFGKLIVEGDSGQRDGSGNVLWRCRCDCGGHALVCRSRLTGGVVLSCGCMPHGRTVFTGAEDLTGRRFGNLTVIRRTENDKGNNVCWICQCDCGKQCSVPALRLKSGHTKSCGCQRYRMSYNARDLTGQRFGRLEALYRLNEDRDGKAFWHCRCDCGKEVDVQADSLVRGLTQSCGCWNQEQSAKMHEHMHYQDDTCLELLVKSQKETGKNKAGFRGLFLTKSGTYRVIITFRKVHYHLGYFKTFSEAVQARLDAEKALHAGYLSAYEKYRKAAERNPKWAEENPFYYDVEFLGKDFNVLTNGKEA